MTTNDKALDAFLGNVLRAGALLEALKAHFDDHMQVAPEEVHWGHVGSAGKAYEDLKALADFLQVKV